MGFQGKDSIESTSSSSSNSLNETQKEKERILFFHIRVISKHTKIDTLFDTGSQANLISEDTIKKLKLETTPHPKPYTLGWISDNAKLHVTRRCKLRFSITTKFIDEVDLDVIPLDICGIVLGSPYYMIGEPSFIVMRTSIICLKMDLSTLLENMQRS
jgi:hypothetical protein